MIYQIKLENFKSYAGERTFKPLHKRFTCVVGPNGSGKSNLIESLLFVFGYRAKKLRLQKISDVIHRSEQFKNIQYAKVSVFFQEIIDYVDEESFYQPVKDSHFVISRLVLLRNETKYFVNQQECSYKDVVTVLRRKGIDLEHN